MLDGEVAAEEFPIEGAVLPLIGVHLSAKESESMPGPIHPLLMHCASCIDQSICADAFQSFIQGLHQLCCSGIKMVIKVHHAQKFLSGPHPEWVWKIHVGVHVGQEGNRPNFSDAVSEEVDSGQHEMALGRVDSQAMPAELFEESPGVRLMLHPGGAWMLSRCCPDRRTEMAGPSGL